MMPIKNNKENILLLGNGINQTYGGISWKEMINKISVRNDLPKHINCPMPLQAILVTNDHVDVAMNENRSSFYGSVKHSKQQEYLHELLSVGFSRILTTNFSYELEMSAFNKTTIDEKQLKQIERHTYDGDVEEDLLLFTFNEVEYNNIKNEIWHIHGEARRPNTIIFGHYYYGDLLFKIKEYIDRINGNFQNKSWVESFLLGDVYVIGFGFDLSEFDLWWLLNRKQQEKKNLGKVYFYSPVSSGFDEKIELLKLLNVEIIDCGFSMDKIKSSKFPEKVFSEFYLSALKDIKKRI